jgi:hypothetical protein
VPPFKLYLRYHISIQDESLKYPNQRTRMKEKEMVVDELKCETLAIYRPLDIQL